MQKKLLGGLVAITCLLAAQYAAADIGVTFNNKLNDTIKVNANGVDVIPLPAHTEVSPPLWQTSKACGLKAMNCEIKFITSKDSTTVGDVYVNLLAGVEVNNIVVNPNYSVTVGDSPINVHDKLAGKTVAIDVKQN